MAKLQDIASATGVSISTVSKALRGFREISPETRRKIAQVAKDLGYAEKRPNRLNPSVDTGTIGVIGLELKSTYYARLVGSLESTLRRNGFDMLLGLSNFEYEREVEILERFDRQEISGLVVITNNEKIDYDLRRLRDKHDLPVVLLATRIALEEFDYVKVNDGFGVDIAIRHLVDLGHRSIGFIGDILCRERMNYYREALAKRGIPVDEQLICIGKERFEHGGYLRMKELLDRSILPTAILASYDDVAIGAIRAIDEAGLVIPDDISIVGIDGIEVGAFLAKPLTTVAAHAEEMAEAAVQILLRKIESKTFTVVQHLEFNPELIIRKSTASPSQPSRNDTL